MTSVHAFAIVHQKAELATDVEVGPFAIIDEHVRVGPGTRIGAHAWLTGWTTLGRDNEVHFGAVLGHVPQDVGFHGGRSDLRIGDRNVIREYATLHRGTKEDSETIVGDDNFLMATAHVAHNCRLGNRCVVANGAVLAGYVELGDRAFVSGNVAVHQFVRIGRLAMMGGNARVSKDVPPFVMVEGNSLVRALNVIGMRRAGLPADARNRIKESYRTLYRRGLPLEEALARLQEAGSAEGREIADFIRGTKRGICRMKNQGEENEGD